MLQRYDVKNREKAASLHYISKFPQRFKDFERKQSSRSARNTERHNEASNTLELTIPSLTTIIAAYIIHYRESATECFGAIVRIETNLGSEKESRILSII